MSVSFLLLTTLLSLNSHCALNAAAWEKTLCMTLYIKPLLHPVKASLSAAAIFISEALRILGNEGRDICSWIRALNCLMGAECLGTTRVFFKFTLF